MSVHLYQGLGFCLKPKCKCCVEFRKQTYKDAISAKRGSYGDGNLPLREPPKERLTPELSVGLSCACRGGARLYLAGERETLRQEGSSG